MEFLASTILGELTTRSIDFFISNISKPTALDAEDNLQRVLLRAQVIDAEAMGRHVTNHAMLLQLEMLNEAIHRGYYSHDTFRYQSHKGDSKNQVLSHSLPLSKSNSWKDLWSNRRKTQIFEQMETSLDYLNSMIVDVKESLILLTSYPLLYRQPYSMHLLLENCMFGRQREAELVIKFLLQAKPHGAKELEVLPITGPTFVGKSTLVSHVCKDERVLDHFSKILFLRDHDFTDDEVATYTEGCAMKHEQCVLSSNNDWRLLIVVDLTRDLNEGAWNKLYSAWKCCVPSGSKIIVISRSDKITKFGTVQTLTLNFLSYEAYWYFFKTLTFGSKDPKVHPRHAYLAMEIARTVELHIGRASMFACTLRENFDIYFWYKVLAFLRGLVQERVSRFGEHPFDVVDERRPSYSGRMTRPSGDLVIYHEWHERFSGEVPKIRLHDVIYGDVRHDGKFEALAWRSNIAPYHSYVFSCEIREQKITGDKRKRSLQDGVTLH